MSVSAVKQREVSIRLGSTGTSQSMLGDLDGTFSPTVALWLLWRWGPEVKPPVWCKIAHFRRHQLGAIVANDHIYPPAYQVQWNLSSRRQAWWGITCTEGEICLLPVSLMDVARCHETSVSPWFVCLSLHDKCRISGWSREHRHSCRASKCIHDPTVSCFPHCGNWINYQLNL